MPPYSKNIADKIKELRIDFQGKFHRIFYFIFIGKNIILLHAFSKKTNKTPQKEMLTAKIRKDEFLINLK